MELHRSLERLETDHFDVYQLHCLPSDDLDTALGTGGAIEVLCEAKEKGLTRFIGITTHWPKTALEALDRAEFDTILFPINFAYWLNANAGQQVLEKAAEKGMGRVGMKSMALQPWPENCERRWNERQPVPISAPLHCP